MVDVPAQIVRAIQRDLKSQKNSSSIELRLNQPGADIPHLPGEWQSLFQDTFSSSIFSGGRLVTTIVISPTDELADAIEDFAGQVQDVVVEEIRVAWPRCPWHDHQLEATRQENKAIWQCPERGFVSQIGDLSR